MRLPSAKARVARFPRIKSGVTGRLVRPAFFFRVSSSLLSINRRTVAGVSRIEKAYLEGDQRRYQVPCLHCGHMAPIEWSNIRWPEGKRTEAYLVCEECGGVMHEHDKPRLLAEGQWQATDHS